MVPFSESDNIGSSTLSVDFYELTMAAAYFYSCFNEKSVKRGECLKSSSEDLQRTDHIFVTVSLEQALFAKSIWTSKVLIIHT
ncbi:MAG TPA: hypothetical protein VFD60_07095 [Nitrososphaeraceae archaeon]|jgi:nicotinic acid phosphoribosyltransferase|nr:hypothetical protein [Nitrososphaeraceae archaeon]